MKVSERPVARIGMGAIHPVANKHREEGRGSEPEPEPGPFWFVRPNMIPPPLTGPPAPGTQLARLGARSLLCALAHSVQRVLYRAMREAMSARKVASTSLRGKTRLISIFS